MSKYDVDSLKRSSREAEDVKEALGKHGNLAGEQTKGVGKALSAQRFALGSAMDHTSRHWWYQVNALYKATEKLEQYLGECAKIHQKTMDANVSSIARIRADLDGLVGPFK